MRLFGWAMTKPPPHLPVCVEKTPQLLAEAMGVKLSTVTSTWTKFVKGNKKYARFAMVFIEKEEECPTHT